MNYTLDNETISRRDAGHRSRFVDRRESAGHRDDEEEPTDQKAQVRRPSGLDLQRRRGQPRRRGACERKFRAFDPGWPREGLPRGCRMVDGSRTSRTDQKPEIGRPDPEETAITGPKGPVLAGHGGLFGAKRHSRCGFWRARRWTSGVPADQGPVGPATVAAARGKVAFYREPVGPHACAPRLAGRGRVVVRPCRSSPRQIAHHESVPAPKERP